MTTRWTQCQSSSSSAWKWRQQQQQPKREKKDCPTHTPPNTHNMHICIAFIKCCWVKWTVKWALERSGAAKGRTPRPTEAECEREWESDDDAILYEKNSHLLHIQWSMVYVYGPIMFAIPFRFFLFSVRLFGAISFCFPFVSYFCLTVFHIRNCGKTKLWNQNLNSKKMEWMHCSKKQMDSFFFVGFHQTRIQITLSRKSITENLYLMCVVTIRTKMCSKPFSVK